MYLTVEIRLHNGQEMIYPACSHSRELVKITHSGLYFTRQDIKHLTNAGVHVQEHVNQHYL